jgi:DNA-binding NtrC family response regulator
MNTFCSNLSTIDPTCIENGLGRRRSEVVPARTGRQYKEVSMPSGLVVSGDNAIRGTLAKILVNCSVVPVFADTIRQAAPYLAHDDLSFVVCQDRLSDGKYQDILLMQNAARSSYPLIVVSLTGDWREFFEALDLGVYDFLAYPLIPGEFQRIIRSLLHEQRLTQAALFQRW